MNYAQISQKLMVQGYSGHAKYNGSLDVASKVLKPDGIRKLYRGFSLRVFIRSVRSKSNRINQNRINRIIILR